MEPVPPGLEAFLTGSGKAKPPPAPTFLGPDGWTGLPAVTVCGTPLGPAHVVALLKDAGAAGEGESLPDFVRQLRSVTTGPGLDALAIWLCQRWKKNGASSREAKALRLCGWLGGDGAALTLAADVRPWAEAGSDKLALLAIELLAAIGSDTAVLHIHRVAEKLRKWPKLQNAASDVLDRLRLARRWTKDQLEDRIAPDGGLDPSGTRCFDYGSRQFFAVIGDDLKPLVRHPDGRRTPSLPRPVKSDDEGKAAACAAEWDVMKKSLALAVKSQVERLKAAMETQRRWSFADYQRFILNHPLNGLLSRRVVWGVFSGGGLPAPAFRVNEDRTLSDSSDHPVLLSPADQVGLTHPAQLESSELQKWLRLFEDYEIIQPFPQIHKPCHRCDDGLSHSRTVLLIEGRLMEPSTFYAMLAGMKWHRESEGLMARPFKHAGVTALLSYGEAGGLIEAGPAWFGKSFSVADAAPSVKNALPLGEIDPVAYSETVRHLKALEAKALVIPNQ